MNEMLEIILNEIQGLRKEMNLKFKEQNEKIEARFREQDERIDARFKEQEERMEAKFKEQDDRITSEFKNIYKMFDEVNKRFDTQTKELAQELRTMADFIYERDKKLFEKLEKKLDEEIKYDRIMLKAHEARINKLEVHQEVLESKFYDLTASKKVG